MRNVALSSTWVVIGALLLAGRLNQPTWAQSSEQLTYADLVRRLTARFISPFDSILRHHPTPSSEYAVSLRLSVRRDMPSISAAFC